MKHKINISKIMLDNAEINAILQVLKSGQLTQGEKVLEFEELFAKYIGVKYTVAVNSGTAALHCACWAVGLKEGDEVITSPFTFAASANCILMCGAKVIFTDIEEETFNIDPYSIKQKITKNTKAIIPIDLYGQPYKFDETNKIAKENNLTIIEDACQAIGAGYQQLKTGKLGKVGCFSFYATKNLMTGEGGMLVTDDKNIADKARLFRNHGQKERQRYQYLALGFNYRMKETEAVLGIEQLKKIDQLNKMRINNANFLLNNLKNIKGLILPEIIKGNYHVFHQFTIRITKDFKITRDQFIVYLKSKNINCGIYYPQPIHLSPHFKKYGYQKGDFPVAEKISQEVVSIPVHPYLTKKDLDYIVKTIKSI